MLLNSAIKTARTPTTPKTKLKMSFGTEGVGVNILLFGETATGKSSIAAQLALAGEKVFTMFTDLGNTGLNGMRAYAYKQNKLEDFDKNHRYVVLNTSDQENIESFIEDPAATVEGFWDFNPTIIMWDGTGFFIKNTIVPETEDLLNKDSRIEGFEGNVALKGWGMVRNDIVRTFDKFCSWRNPQNSPITRIFTTGVSYRSVVVGGDPDKPDCIRDMKPTEEPDIPGSAKRILQYGFDVAALTTKDPKSGGFKLKLAGSYMKDRFTFKQAEFENGFIPNIWEVIKKQRN